ncbi:hypothetical protein [uncultured Treponema sp.]|uniref:hypothetical protein n=1 Tax=uncultured Treponema sp. TaxID=162155 RepID=UPI00258DB110|nr:hypothetical protein [uncultured Treponema sp.]
MSRGFVIYYVNHFLHRRISWKSANPCDSFFVSSSKVFVVFGDDFFLSKDFALCSGDSETSSE